MKSLILKIIPVAVFILIIFIACKKDSFSFQEGRYVGMGHIEQSYWRSDFIPIHPDSMINDRSDFTEVFFPVEVDSMFEDAVLVEVFNDSIRFNDRNNNSWQFPVHEQNTYRQEFSGYTTYTFTIKEDSLFFKDNYVIDRGGPRPGTGRYTFKGVKE